MSTSGSAPRHDLIQALIRELRLSSAQGVLFSHAVAERLGMNSTDLESMDILNLFGPVTPSRLAELTGLTTGAITRLVDRLEEGGWVSRVPDRHDRRSVTIQPLWEEQDSRVWPFFEPMARRTEELLGEYSADQLATLTDFMQRANAIVHEETARLRAERGHPTG